MKRFYRFMMDAALRCGLLLFFITIRVVSRAQSCDSLQCHCSEADLNPSGIMIGHYHPKGTWMLSYRYMFMQMRDNVTGTTATGSDVIFQNYIMAPQSMSMGMHMVMAMYGISSRLSVMAMLNYSTGRMRMNMLPGSTTMQMNSMTMPDMSATAMTYNTSGFGDTRLYATYALMATSKNTLIASAGVNLPTGSIMQTGGSQSMLPGQRLPYMMQLGSGTYDLLPGLTYVLSGRKLTWGTQLTATLHPGHNRLGYAYGNALTATSWLAYRFLPWLSASVRAEAESIGSIRGKDPALFEVMEPGAKAGNYGGTKVSGYFGLNLYLKKLANSKVSFEYGIPAYQNLNGLQLASRAMLYAGWGLSF